MCHGGIKTRLFTRIVIYGVCCLFFSGMIYSMAASAGSIPATADDLERIKYVTPDFRLLPASAFSQEEGQEIYEWDCAGHLMELIPRPGGYQVTLRYDNGTMERRFFTEYSNGQPFPPQVPGCHEWAYTLSLEEVRAAEQLYGQEMTWGEFLAVVAPNELNTMDDTIRSMTFTLPYPWPTREEMDIYLRMERLWTMQMSQCSSVSGVNIPDEQHLLPDLTDVPVGREVIQGNGWKLEIEVRDDPDSSTMAAFYQEHYPDLWSTFSESQKRDLATKPPRIGSVSISRTMNDAQAEIVRGLWGSGLTNAEYFSTVWPEMWAAIPAWYRESEWGDSAYSWEGSADYVDLAWTDLLVEGNRTAAPVLPGTATNNNNATDTAVSRQVLPLSPLQDYPVITDPDGEAMFTPEMQQHLAALGLSTDMRTVNLSVSRLGREGTNTVTIRGTTPDGSQLSWTFRQDGSGLWFDTSSRLLITDDMRFVLVALHAIPEGSPTYNAQPASGVASEYPVADIPGEISTASSTTGIQYPLPDGAIRLDISSTLPDLLSSPSSDTLPLQTCDVPESLQRELTGTPPSPVIQLHMYWEGSSIPYLIT